MRYRPSVGVESAPFPRPFVVAAPWLPLRNRAPHLGHACANDRPASFPTRPLHRWPHEFHPTHRLPAKGLGLKLCRDKITAILVAAHKPVQTLVAEDDEIGVQLLHGALLRVGLAGLDLEPMGRLVGKPVQLARPLRGLELRFNRAGA